MATDRKRRFVVFISLAIVGGLAIGLAPLFFVPGHVRAGSLDTIRLVAGVLIVAAAMTWACYFTFRAHSTMDEFQRQREVTAGFWGGWLGIGASAPIFFLMALSGLRWIAHATPLAQQPLRFFLIGYLLPVLTGAVGAVGARLWMRRRDMPRNGA